MIKKQIKVNNTTVDLIGLTHVIKKHRSLDDLLKKAEIVAVEGPANCPYVLSEGILAAFVGENGLKYLLENSKELTKLDPVVIPKCREYFETTASLSILSVITSLYGSPLLYTSLALASLITGTLSFRLVRYKAYGYKFPSCKRCLGLKETLANLGSPNSFKLRDVGMAYGILRLAEEGYNRVLVTIGYLHFPRILNLLKDPKKLREQFEKYRERYLQTGLAILKPNPNIKYVVPIRKVDY